MWLFWALFWVAVLWLGARLERPSLSGPGVEGERRERPADLAEQVVT